MNIEEMIGELKVISATYGRDLLVVSECDHGQKPEVAYSPQVGNFAYYGNEPVFVYEDAFEEDYPDDDLRVNAVLI